MGFGLGVVFARCSTPITKQISVTPKEPSLLSRDPQKYVAIQSEANKEGYWCKVFKPDILPIWLGSLFSLGVGLIALSTLGDIKKQTRIGLRTSLAAKRSAEAYIATERPFVIIETRGEYGYEFWAVNYGKSPAQIIFSNPVPFVLTPLLAELPDHLDYGSGFDSPNTEQINVQWIAPGRSHPLGAFEPKIMEFIGNEAAVELATSRRVMIVYSAFKYRGIHSKQVYTSTYCYRKYPSGLQMWGGCSWNKYT